MIHVLFINEMTSCEKESLWFKKNAVLIWGIVGLRSQHVGWRLRIWSPLYKGRGEAGAWWKYNGLKRRLAAMLKEDGFGSPSYRKLCWCPVSSGTQRRNRCKRLGNAKDRENFRPNTFNSLLHRSRMPRKTLGRNYQASHHLWQQPLTWPEPPGEWWHLLTHLDFTWVPSLGCCGRASKHWCRDGIVSWNNDVWLETDKLMPVLWSVCNGSSLFLSKLPHGLSGTTALLP